MPGKTNTTIIKERKAPLPKINPNSLTIANDETRLKIKPTNIKINAGGNNEGIVSRILSTKALLLCKYLRFSK